MNDLGLDSLDHVEIIVALENEFGKNQQSSINQNKQMIFFQVLKFLMLTTINCTPLNPSLII